MKHNENSRVKIPALVHLTRLGYEYLSLKNYHGIIHPDTNIFVDIFRESISCINGKILSEQDCIKKTANSQNSVISFFQCS